jgi:hypothetical protein
MEEQNQKIRRINIEGIFKLIRRRKILIGNQFEICKPDIMIPSREIVYKVDEGLYTDTIVIPLEGGEVCEFRYVVSKENSSPNNPLLRNERISMGACPLGSKSYHNLLNLEGELVEHGN